MSTTAPEDAERRSIRDAMERLLKGSPLHSDGKLTVKSLADEAQVKRWLLTHRHTDLQDEFRAKVDQHGRVPEAIQKFLDEEEALKERIDKLSASLAVERETVKRLERVVHVLTVEREQERQAATPKANVRPIRAGM